MVFRVFRMSKDPLWWSSRWVVHKIFLKLFFKEHSVWRLSENINLAEYFGTKKKLSSRKKISHRTLKWYISQIIYEKFKQTEYLFIFGWERNFYFFYEQENAFDAPLGSYTLLCNCVFHILCSNVNDWRESIMCSYFS